MGKSRCTAVDLDYKKLRKGVVSLNCKQCGAGLKGGCQCEYCDTLFAGETVEYLRQLGELFVNTSMPAPIYPPYDTHTGRDLRSASQNPFGPLK